MLCIFYFMYTNLRQDVYIYSMSRKFGNLCKNLYKVFANFLAILYMFTIKEFNFNVTTYLFIIVP